MTHHILAPVGKTARTLTRLLRDERGSTAIEYGLMAALIAVAAIQALASLGAELSLTFGSAAEAMSGESGPTTPILAPGGS